MRTNTNTALLFYHHRNLMKTTQKLLLFTNSPNHRSLQTKKVLLAIHCASTCFPLMWCVWLTREGLFKQQFLNWSVQPTAVLLALELNTDSGGKKQTNKQTQKLRHRSCRQCKELKMKEMGQNCQHCFFFFLFYQMTY